MSKIQQTYVIVDFAFDAAPSVLHWNRSSFPQKLASLGCDICLLSPPDDFIGPYKFFETFDLLASFLSMEEAECVIYQRLSFFGIQML